jgi:hypothetical protein
LGKPQELTGEEASGKQTTAGGMRKKKAGSKNRFVGR